MPVIDCIPVYRPGCVKPSGASQLRIFGYPTGTGDVDRMATQDGAFPDPEELDMSEPAAAASQSVRRFFLFWGGKVS